MKEARENHIIRSIPILLEKENNIHENPATTRYVYTDSYIHSMIICTVKSDEAQMRDLYIFSKLARHTLLPSILIVY